MKGKQTPESFIARIWLERGSNGDPMWRGHVQHVQGNEETYFQDLGAMSEFLGQVSGVAGPPTTGELEEGATGSYPDPATEGKDN